MAKPALGRGLEHLMHGAKPVNSPDQPALPLSDSSEPKVGPGLDSLLQGKRNRGGGAARPSRVPRPSRSLQWTLWAADALLMVLAAWIIFGGARRLGVWEVVLCVVAVGLAAALGCRAFLMGRR